MRLASWPYSASFGAATNTPAFDGALETLGVRLALLWPEVLADRHDDVLSDQHQDPPRADVDLFRFAVVTQFPRGVSQQNLHGQQRSFGLAMHLGHSARPKLDTADRPFVGAETIDPRSSSAASDKTSTLSHGRKFFRVQNVCQQPDICFFAGEPQQGSAQRRQVFLPEPIAANTRPAPWRSHLPKGWRSSVKSVARDDIRIR